MNFLYEVLPVFLFFITFKYVNIYAATKVGIVATAIQVLVTRYWLKKWDKKQLITLAVFLTFGSLTLYFHNPIFVKWKPSIIFWTFAAVIFFTHLFFKKKLVEQMFSPVMQEATVPAICWSRLNILWGVFFSFLGGINLYIAYFYDDNTWVNFKFYGITVSLLVLSVFQALYLSRYFSDAKPASGSDE